MIEKGFRVNIDKLKRPSTITAASDYVLEASAVVAGYGNKTILQQLDLHILPGEIYALHQFANTDLPAQLHYQDQIANYHKQIRTYYYPYLFHDFEFNSAKFDARPMFKPESHDAGSIHMHTWMMLILCWLIAGLGIRSIYN